VVRDDVISDQDELVLALYSDDRVLRDQVCVALGSRIADDLPPVRILEFATANALMAAFDAGSFDCLILDAEAAPLGGMGLGYQIKDEIDMSPPIVLLVARQVDAWLAIWSRADAVAPLPIDPLTLPDVVANVIRADIAGTLQSSVIVPGAASRH